jgi:MFS transporter, YNFM family, putative membrane transport protein
VKQPFEFETISEVDVSSSKSVPPSPPVPPISLILTVGLCGICAFLNTYATQPLLPLFTNIFHASKAAVGLTVSATSFGVAISAPVIGALAERYSRKRIIVASLIAQSIPTIMTATSPTLHALIVWRFLQGLIMPGIFAIAIAYITEEFPPQRVAFMMSVYVSGTATGGLIGRIFSGLIAARFGWRWGFVVLGAVSLIGAAVIAKYLPKERNTGLHEGPSIATQFRQVRNHLHNPRLLATYAVGFNVLFSLVAVFSYITFYLADPPFHMSVVALSYLFTVYIVGVFVSPAAGYIISRTGLLPGILTAVSVSMAGVLLTLIHSVPVVILGLALTCTGVFIAQATATSYIRVASPEGGRVSAVGLYLCCYYLGGTAGGVAPSLFWSMGKWPACAIFIVVIQMASLIIALLGWRDWPMRRPSHA